MICRRCCRRLLQPTSRTHGAALNLRGPPLQTSPWASFSTGRGQGATENGRGHEGAQHHLRMWKDPKVAVSHLEDPLKLAENTQYLLRRGEQKKALESVRAASKSRACTVSWNHLINHDMGKGRVTSALATYNEMKKRGQVPDAFTYTIVLRGLARNLHKTPTAVERALSIFHSMLAPNCPVRPSTIHVNATIEVCAKARNLDALYGITARLPESGAGSPDCRTYTLIFNCLADVARVAKGKGASYKQRETPQLTRDMVTQGRRIWADVVLRWTAGNIEMDEQLACSMGRLLLLGDIKNTDEALSLVQQTAMLSRELPPIGDPKRPTQHIRYPRRQHSEEEPLVAEQLADQNRPSENPALDEELFSRNIFEPIAQTTVTRSYAVPGNEMLSLVLGSCLKMNAIKAAQSYWGKISSRVAPDLSNFHEYIRILRLSRASSLTVELLKQMATPKDQDGFGLALEPKTFLIAMSACSRDHLNPSCLRNATDILLLMSETIDVPDAYATQTASEILGSRLKEWKVEEILAALEALEKNQALLKSHYSYGADASSKPTTGGWREKVVACLRSYCDVLTRVLDTFREQIDPETTKTLVKRLETHTLSYQKWRAANTNRALREGQVKDDSRRVKKSQSAASDPVAKATI